MAKQIRDFNEILIDIYEEMSDHISIISKQYADRPWQFIDKLQVFLCEKYLDMITYFEKYYRQKFEFDHGYKCHIFHYELTKEEEEDVFDQIEDFVSDYNSVFGDDFGIKLYE